MTGVLAYVCPQKTGVTIQILQPSSVQNNKLELIAANIFTLLTRASDCQIRKNVPVRFC